MSPVKGVPLMTGVALPPVETSPDALLVADLALLTRLHRQVLTESGRGELATLMDSLQVAAAGAADGGDPEAPSHIIGGLPAATAASLAQALTVHFHLINLAEERHRSRLLRRADPRSGDATPDMWPAVAALGELASRVRDLRVHPVLTAHPTERYSRGTAWKSVWSNTCMTARTSSDGCGGVVRSGEVRLRMSISSSIRRSAAPRSCWPTAASS